MGTTKLLLLDSLLQENLCKLSRWLTRSLGSLRTSCWPVWPLVSPRPWLPPSRGSSFSSRTRTRLSSRVVWTSLIPESLTAPRGCWPLKALFPSGEETWPTCCVTSPPRLLTLPSRIPSRPCLPPPRTLPTPPSLPPTLPPVALLEPCPSCLCTPLTLPGPGWPTTPRVRVASASLTD